MTTDYPGLDYSGPGSNVNRDPETGIRYGMISFHTVKPEALNDVFTYGEDLDFSEMQEELKKNLTESLKATVEEVGGQLRLTDEIVQEILDSVEWDYWESDGDCDRYLLTEQNGLTVQSTRDGNLWVFKSPWYTRAQFCSPCVPGAGNLDSFCPDKGVKTYCLGPDWFDKDRPCPHSIWKVDDDSLVHEYPG